jgi:NAD dependent epimerase/dehydratase family enzyme
LAAAFVHAAQQETMDGVYNAVGVAPATNRDFSAALARVLNTPFWAPAPPAFLLRLVLGDRSALVLGSTPATSDKLRATGFVHRHTDLEAALASVVQP